MATTAVAKPDNPTEGDRIGADGISGAGEFGPLDFTGRESAADPRREPDRLHQRRGDARISGSG